jgi:peptidyl-prolyl cis-trans isomerase C
MVQKLIPLLILPLFMLIGCQQSDENKQGMDMTTGTAGSQAEATSPGGKVVAVVNGVEITQPVVDLYTEQKASHHPGGNAPDEQAVLNELVSLELMKQEAEKKGIDNQTAIIAQLEQSRRALLASAAIKDYIQNNPISDEELKATYDTEMAVPSKEYKARHILVPTEAEARNVITQLNEGADFAELAKEKSTGPTGKNGGELGWFAAEQMVTPFSEATAALEKGTYTKEPVQTQFGWHVILLEDSRDSTPPPFDEIKDQLKAAAQGQRIMQYVQQVRSSAQIDVKEPE